MTWSSEINRRLKNIKGYIGTFPKDQLPIISKYPSSLILNTHPSTMSGEHWVAVYINKNGFGEYFDPFGLRPLIKEFYQFLNRNCPDGWTFNEDMIQDLTSKKCGEFCIVFLYLRSLYNFSMSQIVNLFKREDLNVNDVILNNIFPYFK